MEVEKLKEILGIEDDSMDEKLEAAVTAMNEETQNLVKTKDKLREQVKDLDKKLKSFKDVDLEEVETMRTELEELREAANAEPGETGKKISPEERKAIEERAAKKVQDQLDSLQKRYDELEKTHEGAVSKYHNTLVERELRQAIKKNGVKPEAEDLIFRAFRSDAQVEVDDDGSEFVHFQNKDGLKLPPEEYLADWAKTDSAKEFIKPPENTGGGAHGGGGPGKGKQLPRAEFNKLSPAEQHKFVTEQQGSVVD
ncbi:MAG: hypothetical protein WD492_12885 [Alkalispirochaeta sp.]